MHIGESFIGSGLNAAHINAIIGPRVGPVGAAWAGALSSPAIDQRLGVYNCCWMCVGSASPHRNVREKSTA